MQAILLFIQEQKILVLTLIFLIIVLMIVEWIRQKKGHARVNPQKATQMINHQNAIILDIRGTDAFAHGHIVGSLSIPFTDLENKYKKLDQYKSQPIVITCATGLESPRAAIFLKKQGFNVSLLAHGIQGWKEADLPLVKG